MQSTEELANWAVNKQNKLCYVQTMQSTHAPRNYNDQPNRKSNRTFTPNPTPSEPRGDPMDLDLSTKKGYLNLSKQEYERRKKENLCFKCGRKGHSIGRCLLNQIRWPAQSKIREFEVNNEPENSGRDFKRRKPSVEDGLRGTKQNSSQSQTSTRHLIIRNYWTTKQLIS